MSTRRRRMRYQPSKAQCIFTGIIGIFFCLIGLFVALPNFGLFGLVWTGIAVVINALRMMTQSGGILELSGLQEQPMRVFRASGIDKLVTMKEEVK